MKEALIIDDHPVFLEGLVDMLQDAQWKTISCASYVEFIEKSLGKTFDLALVDLQLPNGKDGFDICEQLHGFSKPPKIIIISFFSDDQLIAVSKKLNVNGYLSKNAEKPEILAAIESVMAGEIFYSPDLKKRMELRHNFMKRYELSNRVLKKHGITEREGELLEVIANIDNTSDQHISEILGISKYTVRQHKKSLHKKLDVKQLAGLIKFYYQHLHKK